MEGFIFYKGILSFVAMAITFVAFVPYIRAILTGTTKPHMFSWVIWSITTSVVFWAQVKAEGGVGAWPIGVSGCLSLSVAVLAFLKRGDLSITKSDWLFFVSALSSLPFWYFTSSPLAAVVILTTVDVLGFGPTVRKLYQLPYSEPLVFFSLFAVRDFLVILALESYSSTTVLFPAAIGTSCFGVVVLGAYRRRWTSPPERDERSSLNGHERDVRFL